MTETLGHFEQAVMLSVIRLGEEAYGRKILADVRERQQRETSAGAVYATLDRLEGKRLVLSRLGEGTPVRAGRPRRYYAVATAGVQALNDSRLAHENIWRGFAWPSRAARMT